MGCPVHGVPVPEVSWLLNGRPVQESAQLRSELSFVDKLIYSFIHSIIELIIILFKPAFVRSKLRLVN